LRKFFSLSLVLLGGFVVLGGFACAQLAAAHATKSADALILGKLVHCGGAFPGRCVPDENRVIVSAFNAEHHLVAREWVTDGRFSFLLRPGHFTVRAQDQGVPPPIVTRHVRAKAHRTTRTTIVFPVP
jgi:hypothetical protein